MSPGYWSNVCHLGRWDGIIEYNISCAMVPSYTWGKAPLLWHVYIPCRDAQCGVRSPGCTSVLPPWVVWPSAGYNQYNCMRTHCLAGIMVLSAPKEEAASNLVAISLESRPHEVWLPLCCLWDSWDVSICLPKVRFWFSVTFVYFCEDMEQNVAEILFH